MRKRLVLKNWVLVSTLSILVIGLIGLTSYISKTIITSLNIDNNSYVLRDLINNSFPVVSEVDNLSGKPFNDEEVKIHTKYYDFSSTKEEQEKALILYENTYMPNTGILYTHDKEFDCVAIYEGEILSITEDEIIGTIVEVKHTNNIITKYSSLSSVDVSVGETVNKGEKIGTSGENKIISENKNMLLFEVLYNGTHVNPEEYYNKNFDEMR